MESKLLESVRKMHIKFGLENTIGPCALSDEEKEFRYKAMMEEVNEYMDATTLVDQYDALIDLIVFAVGTLERQGLPLLQGFEAVMRANMKKELGQNGQKRGGFKRDLVKPRDWVGPEDELQDIIGKSFSAQAPLAFDSIDVAPSSDGKIVEGFAPKFDNNKVRVDLLPVNAMMDIAAVFTFGAKKYFANSYRSGETVVWSRTYGSILRHLFAFWNGQDTDQESGLHHLAHAGTQLMILMEHVSTKPEKDDRFKG